MPVCLCVDAEAKALSSRLGQWDCPTTRQCARFFQILLRQPFLHVCWPPQVLFRYTSTLQVACLQLGIPCNRELLRSCAASLWNYSLLGGMPAWHLRACLGCHMAIMTYSLLSVATGMPKCCLAAAHIHYLQHRNFSRGGRQ